MDGNGPRNRASVNRILTFTPSSAASVVVKSSRAATGGVLASSNNHGMRPLESKASAASADTDAIHNPLILLRSGASMDAGTGRRVLSIRIADSWHRLCGRDRTAFWHSTQVFAG